MELAGNKLCNFVMMYTVFRKKLKHITWLQPRGPSFYISAKVLKNNFKGSYMPSAYSLKLRVNPNHNCNIRLLNFKLWLQRWLDEL